MTRRVVSALTLVLLLTCPRTLLASTIVAQTHFDGFSTGIGGTFEQTLALFSWTQSNTFTNVSITAFLAGVDAAYHGTAYLMNQIGPGTTAANQVVSPSTFSAVLPLFAFHDVTVFSGLTLGPGTYFVVLWAPQSNTSYFAWGGTDPSTSTFTRAAGVTGAADFYVAQGSSPYPPAQNFFAFTNHDLTFAVTGDLGTVAAVPEPGTLLMLATGFIGARAARRRRISR